MADYRPSRIVAVVVLFGLIALTSAARAQRRWDPISPIPAGTTLQVRTLDSIRANAFDGRIYRGEIENDVLDVDGRLAIEAGSTAELVARDLGGGELDVDLDSVTVQGRRFAVRADSDVVGTSGREVFDSRTGQSAIAGAVVGSIIGAIAGGGKGAAIGAGVGAAAGAGARIATRGRNVDVPSDTTLMFRLTRPIYIDVADDGYDRDGFHYHGYPR